MSNNSNNTITKYNSSGALTQTISGNLNGTRWLAFKPDAVPEPSSYLLAATGLVSAALLRRRRRPAAAIASRA